MGFASHPLTPHAHHPIGVMGGTFDPIHFGHLRMAEELADALNLSDIRFIPAGQPPHRNSPHVVAAHRLEMVRLAVAGNSRLSVDAREVQQQRPSYTVDTLTDLRLELGNDTPIWLLMGLDAFLGLPGWKDWTRLFELAHLAVAHRPGYKVSDGLSPVLLYELQRRATTAPPTSPAGNIFLTPVTQLDISATQIRALLARGKRPHYLTPEGVIHYIEQHRLYSAT